jgi:hypothetical protein
MYLAQDGVAVVESCEHGNKLLGTKKRQGISWLAERLLASQGLCSVELVQSVSQSVKCYR